MIPKYKVWDTVKKAMSEVQAIVYTEKKVLDDVVEKLENFKEYIKSGCRGGC